MRNINNQITKPILNAETIINNNSIHETKLGHTCEIAEAITIPANSKGVISHLKLIK